MGIRCQSLVNATEGGCDGLEDVLNLLLGFSALAQAHLELIRIRRPGVLAPVVVHDPRASERVTRTGARVVESLAGARAAVGGESISWRFKSWNEDQIQIGLKLLCV